MNLDKLNASRVKSRVVGSESIMTCASVVSKQSTVLLKKREQELLDDISLIDDEEIRNKRVEEFSLQQATSEATINIPGFDISDVNGKC